MKMKFVLPALVVMGGIVCSTAVYSKPADSTKTKRSCAVCHKDAKKAPKELTEAGAAYKKDGTVPPAQK
jgi:hypothetical protein